MTTPNPPNINVPSLHDALAREVLAHFNGTAIAAPTVLFDDRDGTFSQFCHCERCKTLQQFLFLHRAAPVLASLPLPQLPPADAGDSDASTASTLHRSTPPLAAAAAAATTPPDSDNDEGLAWCSDSSGIGDYPDGDEHIPDESIVNSSDSSAAGSDSSSSSSSSISSTSDEDAQRKNRYFVKLQRKLRSAIALESQRSSNAARKRAHQWFRRKMHATNASSQSIELHLNRARRHATALRSRLFPSRRH